jgi:hypothetical protein
MIHSFKLRLSASRFRASIDSMPRPKASAKKSSTTVVRDVTTGRLTVGGKDERKLVNRHTAITVKAAPGKPKHLSAIEIREGVKRMKVA